MRPASELKTRIFDGVKNAKNAKTNRLPAYGIVDCKTTGGVRQQKAPSKKLLR